ncbi:MAG: hypothetical protein NTAFB09_26260 [Nitrosospira sp.]
MKVLLIHSGTLHPLDGFIFIILCISDTSELIAALLSDDPAHFAKKLLFV